MGVPNIGLTWLRLAVKGEGLLLTLRLAGICWQSEYERSIFWVKVCRSLVGICFFYRKISSFFVTYNKKFVLILPCLLFSIILGFLVILSDFRKYCNNILFSFVAIPIFVHFLCWRWCWWFMLRLCIFLVCFFFLLYSVKCSFLFLFIVYIFWKVDVFWHFFRNLFHNCCWLFIYYYFLYLFFRVFVMCRHAVNLNKNSIINYM